MKKLRPLDPRGRPEPYRAPDRAAWKQRKGVDAFPAPDSARLEGYAEIARGYVDQDWASLSADECHGIHADLDILHDQVSAELGTDSIVFFNPDDGQFWVYPDPEQDAK
jgi:hypothetical protein